MKRLIGFLLFLYFSPGLSGAELIPVYDNQIVSVNNGRVNDPEYPTFLRHADSFVLSETSTIDVITWLGAYKGSTPAAALDDFTIQFFEIATNGIPSTAPLLSLNLGSVSRQSTSDTLPSGWQVYSYSASVSALVLDPGSYLIVFVNDPAGSAEWLWADRDASPGQSYMMIGEGSNWRQFSGNGVAEFAFALYANFVGTDPPDRPHIPWLLLF